MGKLTFTVSLRNQESYLESIDVLSPSFVKQIKTTLNKFDKFLTDWRFTTFQKNMNIRQRGNRRRKTLNESELDMELELRWNLFLDNFEVMLEMLPTEFRDISTEILRPQLHLFKKMLDLDRKNKKLKPLRDSFLTQEGTEWTNYN